MDWKRGEVLCRGGFSTVYLATIQQPSQQPLVVKSTPFYHSRVLQHERSVYSYLGDHPCIIRCIGDEVEVEHGQSVYNLLLEYASGGTLADRIKCFGKGLPENEVRSYTKAMLLGLKFVHEQRIVHCNIKPQNVLLVRSPMSNSYRAKISDFGLAKRVGDYVESRVGTDLYMAPESVAYHEYEPECDVWALGCVVLEMLTGKPAWDIQTRPSTDLFDRIVYGDELPTIPSDLSRNARDFVKRCFVRDTQERGTTYELLSHPFVEGVSEEVQRVEGKSMKLGLWLTLGVISICILRFQKSYRSSY